MSDVPENTLLPHDAVKGKKVCWTVLNERNIQQDASDSLLDVSGLNYALGFDRISRKYTRTDLARNLVAAKFLQVTNNPMDTLVMLDNDHIHPQNVVEQLVMDDKPVIAALAHLRGEPFNACAFVFCPPDNLLHPLADLEDAIYPVHALGHPAIAIQRWVFQALEAAGKLFPWWRYEYTEYNLLREDGTVKGEPIPFSPSEDMYFSRICREANIPMFVDGSVKCPHITTTTITEQTFKDHVAKHSELADFRQVQIDAPIYGLEDK